MSSVPWWLHLILLTLLACGCGQLVAGLSALSQLNEPQLQDRAEEGDADAKRLCKLLDQKEKASGCLISALALGCMICGAYSGSLLSHSVLNRLASLGLSNPDDPVRLLIKLVLILAVTFFMLIMGYALPDRLAARHPEKILLRLTPMLSVVLPFMRPMNGLVKWLTGWLLRLAGIDPNEQTDEVTEEEIRAMVDMGEETGAIETAEREMIENIFEFNNRSAQDVMTHRTDVELIWIEDDKDAILDLIRRTGLSRFPVCEKDIDDVVGILNTRDYLMELQHEHPRPLRALLREPYFVPGTVQADALFRTMQRRKQHMAIVTDEYGGVSGLITMEDLLEEIVGNIYDEFDLQDETSFQMLEDGSWRISGSATLDEVEEHLQLSLPEDESYDTLGGLIFSRLSMIPQDGETPDMDVCGLHIHVERIAEHRVETAIVSLLPPDEHQQDAEKRNDHE